MRRRGKDELLLKNRRGLNAESVSIPVSSAPKVFQSLSPQRRKCFNPCLLSVESVSIPVSSAPKAFQSLSPQRQKHSSLCLLSAESVPIKQRKGSSERKYPRWTQ